MGVPLSATNLAAWKRAFLRDASGGLALAAGQVAAWAACLAATGMLRGVLLLAGLLLTACAARRMGRRLETVSEAERRLAECHTRLEASEARFHAVAAYACDVETWHDASGRLVWINNAARRLHGCMPEECLALPDYPAPFLHEDDRDWVLRLFAEAVAQRTSGHDLQFRMRDRHGAMHWVSLSWQPLFDAHGRHLGTRAGIRDVSDRRRAEEQLRTLSYALEQSPVSVVITDRTGRIEYVNPKFSQLTGYAAEEAVGQRPRILRSGEHPREVYATLWQTILAGHEWRGELCNRRKDGTLFWENCVISPLRGTQDDITHFVAIKEDITARKEAEEELRDSQQRLALHFQQTPLAVIEWDAEFRVVQWNPGAERIFGYPRSAALGKHASFIIPENARTAVDTVWADLLAGRGGERCGNNNLTRDGRTIHCEWYNTPLVGPQGNVVGVVSLVEDITQRKSAEEALRKKEEEFRQSQKLEAVGALAGGVAHEFNNLLQVIQAFAGFAQKGLPADDPRNQDLAEVFRAADRAVYLTRQLLGFARRQQLQPALIDTNQVVSDLAKMLRPLLGEKIEVALSLDPHTGRLLADPSMLQQVVINLCVNARDAMPGGGKLRIATDSLDLDAAALAGHRDCVPGRYVRLRVADTGSGIPPEILGHIFEPFFTTKGAGQGTGLGLAMVYGVVQQHHGTIRVESAPGRGTCFEICLPAAASCPPPADNACAAPPRGDSELILIAEDDPLVRRSLQRLLGEAGYRTLAAADGAEAVTLFQRHAAAVSLLLFDVFMPRLNGHEAYAAIAAQRPDLPVVYCTGYDPFADAADVAEMKNCPVVAKPVALEVLLTTVREALDRRSTCVMR